MGIYDYPIGATGIEPVTSGSQNQHSTAELRPEGGRGGIRTHGCFHIASFQD